MIKPTEHKLREYQIIKRDFFEQECETEPEDDYRIIDHLVGALVALAVVASVSVLIVQVLKFYR